MKIKKPKILILTLCLVALVASAAGAYTVYNHRHASSQATASNGGKTRGVNSVNYNPPTEAQKKNGEQIKEEATSTKDSSNTGSSGTTSTTGSISISRVSQPSSGQPVSVRTTVEGLPSGTCTITFTLNGQPAVTKTVAIVAGATFYTCQPLDVASSDFSTSGTWTVSVFASNASAKTSTVTRTVTINK